MDDDTDQLIRSYFASFSLGDAALVADHVTDDFSNVHTAAIGGGCVGRTEYLQRLPGFLATFVDVHYRVEQIVTQDRHVAGAYRMTARYDGHPIDIRGVMLFEVRDGRIARRTDYWDSLHFLRQTGQSPTPPS